MLSEKIDSQAECDFDSGRKNHLADLWCTIGSVIASCVATILAGSGAPTWLIALFAAVPGVCTTLQRLVDFRGRAAWYFLKAARLRGISLAVRHEGLAIDAASRQFRETEIELERQWPQFVNGGHPPIAQP